MTVTEYQIHVLRQYLSMKATVRDWHAVADAAMDLRELEIQLKHEKEEITRANKQSHSASTVQKGNEEPQQTTQGAS